MLLVQVPEPEALVLNKFVDGLVDHLGICNLLLVYHVDVVAGLISVVTVINELFVVSILFICIFRVFSVQAFC